MKPEQQRAILKAAAKACGFKKWRELTGGLFQFSTNENWNEAFAEWTYWNPINNSADCAAMCAKLEINQFHWPDAVACDTQRPPRIGAEASLKDHGNSRLKAWMYAATMVAAKIGGYTE